MRVGVVLLPTDPWPETVERARRLDALGYDHLWTYDHLSWRRYRERDWHAAMPWLTGVAMATERIAIGPMVASPNFRHPVTLAKEAMTLDHISGGRVILGVGAGGIGFDATTLGGTVLPARERAARLVAFTDALDELLRSPRTTRRDDWYAIDEARMIPGCVQRPRLPIWVAAAGPTTIGLAGRMADGWITYGPADDPEATATATEAAVRDQLRRVHDACAAAGRDPSAMRTLYLIGNAGERPTASAEAFADFAGRYAAIGFTDLAFHHPRADDPAWDDPPAVVESIAATVLPTIR